MPGSREIKKQKNSSTRCGTFCCSCRISVSSSEGVEGSNSDRFAPISSLAHAMVQERLDQMIRERVESRNEGIRKKGRVDGTKYIIMVAMEKYSYDPREDFRESMVEVITANQIDEPKELRRLLNCYLSMNLIEHRPIILEAFHEVCANLFLCCKCH